MAFGPRVESRSDFRQSVLSSWVAVDPVSHHLLQEAVRIAQTSSPVLICGENGTGKELLASLLHYLGPRVQSPLVTIDCATLPHDVVDAELFGYEKGAIPGASQPKPGRLENASGGTLILNEVAALTTAMQAKLLRVIAEKRFERLGSTRSMSVDARVVALTSIDLEQAVIRRTFREDLYYRLNVVPMQVPALRDRRADIRALAEYFLLKAVDLQRKPRITFAAAAMHALQNYAYPGNVEELRNVVERAAFSANPPEITLADLPPHVRDAASAPGLKKMSLEDLERSYIAEVLEYTRGKKTRAAQILGISRKTLLEKRKRYGLE